MAGGDMVVESSGRFVTATELQKADQDIKETFQNNFDPFDPPWYPTGSEFFKLDTEPLPTNDLAIESRIHNMAFDSLNRLIDAQQDDSSVDDAELIAEVESIDVWKIGDMSWAFYSKCVTDSDEFVETNFEYEFESDGLPAGVVPTGNHIVGEGTPL